MEGLKFRKVGSLDGQSLLRCQDDILYKVVKGELQSDDLWDEPLECHLIVDFETELAVDVRIAGMSKDDLPDGFEYEFKGVNGEEYAGNLCWG